MLWWRAFHKLGTVSGKMVLTLGAELQAAVGQHYIPSNQKHNKNENNAVLLQGEGRDGQNQNQDHGNKNDEARPKQK